MFAQRVKRARAAAGLSMQELASQIGISANMIKKYEHGSSMPSSSTLIRLAKALGVKSEYFFRPTTIELGKIQYRKQASLSKALLHKIEADVIDQAERWLELKNLWPNFPIASPNINLRKSIIQTYEEVEAVAEDVRNQWALGEQAIPNLSSLLESHGFIVIMSNIETTGKCDGLQAVLNETPILVCQKEGDGARQRFTLAHELGHFILSNHIDEKLDEEIACHRFAQALLLPLETVKTELGSNRHSLEIAELYHIKQRYGISMQACARRAFYTHIISETTYTKICREFSAKGWRKQEPGSIYPIERTTLFTQLVYRALAEGIITEAKAAELLGQSLFQFSSRELW